LINKQKNTYFIETFGCQMNVNDSQKVAGLLEADGYEPAPTSREADFVFINTCAVREKASEKLFHALGRLRSRKRSDPKLRIGVGGCVAQLQGESILARAPEVDLLVGTHTLSRVPDLLRDAQAGDGATPHVDLDRKADAFSVPASSIVHGNPVRAYVTVMEGCNHVCSFCVVPRTRGPEANRSPGQIVDEVRSLVARGFPEVMLLGQTVNAYRHESHDFGDLLRLVSAVPGLRRLRFTTSHPSHVTEHLAQALRDLPNACPYLHLPVQSGSDRVLAGMRRGYSALQYQDAAALLRRHVPELALSTDVIVGYPGETLEDFKQTVELVDRMRFDGLFVFMYSPRPGTLADRLEDDVPDDEKLRRLQILNDRQQQAQALRNRAQIGGVQEVLVESDEKQGRLSGRTPQFRIVHLDGPPSWIGRFVHVEIRRAGPNSLVGRPTNVPTNSLTATSGVPIF
jgi:tRNA-2-methylthio-N6-dimethylallyladenosine synthase